MRAQTPRNLPQHSALGLWGWGRLVLGVMQMLLAGASVYLLVTEGLTGRTWVIIVSGAVAVVLSRFLFRGRRGPTLDGH